MTPEDRAKKYIQQMDIQRSKMFHAWAKLTSYYSKVAKNPELLETVSDEDLAKMRKTVRKTRRLLSQMRFTAAREWGGDV